jgi:DNA-directed RNA polymerase specialized sigma24 family protein
MTRKPPTQEAFEKFLAWLGPDREQAGETYQKIQFRLTKIFSCHGCTEPETLADETIDRVIGKTDWLMENYVGDPIRYFCGVARNVLKEDIRYRVIPKLPLKEETEDDEGGKERYDCLDKCLAELPQPGRSLVLAYYAEEGNAKIVIRKKLAAEAGITMRALRLRVFHIRLQLSKCMKTCLSQVQDSETLLVRKA